MDNFQLRHFDYVLPIASLPAGQQQRYPLVLDTDSSFILRGRAVHVQSSTVGLSGQVAALTSYFERFTGPDQDDLSDSLTRFYNDSRVLGQYGLFLPVRTPMIYPAGGTIYVDVRNDSGSDYTNLELYFRGQKIFAPGVLPCYTYPERMITRPYWIPLSNVMPCCSSSRGNVLKANSYADFVMRSLSIGSFDPAGDLYYQMYIQLRDMSGRSYSNVPVNVDVAYGAHSAMVAGAAGAVGYGNFLPPLLTPEIYLPATQYLQYDLYRSDTFVGSDLGDVTMWLVAAGAQVWKK